MSLLAVGCHEWNENPNFPGAYTHQIMESIGTDGILKLMKGVKNRKAYYREAFDTVCVDDKNYAAKGM